MAVSEQIIQVINTLCAKVGIVIDWTGDNVIPYITMLCEKLIMFEITTSIVWCVLFLALAATATILRKKFYPIWKAKHEADRYDECYIALMVFAVLIEIGFWITFTAVSAVQMFNIVKCLAFPEMYVFEYISKLMAK